MAIHTVTPSSAIDMLGPYLTARVTYPGCNKENVLLHLEGPTSPVKAYDVCTHRRSVVSRS